MTETPVPALAGQETPPPARRERRLLASLWSLVLVPLRLSRAALGLAWRRPGRVLLVGALLLPLIFGAVYLGFNLRAGYHFRTAQSCLDQYRDAEALEHLHACLQVWPHDPDTLLLAARAARRLGAFPEARDFLDRYHRSRGDDDNLSLENVLLRVELGDLDRNRTYCQLKVEANHPSTPLILEAQARGYLRSCRLQEAQACLKQWLDRQPDNPQVFLLKGKVYDESLDTSAAIASYRRVLQLDPENDDARWLLAGHLLDVAEGRKALPHVKYLLRQQPDNPLLRVFLARCRSQMGQQTMAEEILDDLLTRQPHHVDALVERGRLALQRGQPKAAENWLRDAAAQDPTNYQANYQLFRALTRNSKAEEAGKLHKRLKQMEDDMKRSREIITREIQVSPHNPALHYEVGEIALRAGSVAQALRWLHSALREDPYYAPAHRVLAMYYQETGSPGRAARHRDLADASARNLPEQK